MKEPIWIERDLVLAIHSRQLAEHGGADGVRDAGLLESALGRPRHCFAYDLPASTIVQLAAAYAFGVARNHPFVDGNKRTAAVVRETFLVLNGVAIGASDVEMYPVFLSLAEGSLSEMELSDWLAQRVRETE